MQTVIIVVHLMVVLAMVGVVLLQKSEGGGLGIGSSGGGGFMSSRGTANVLTRATAFLAIGFFITSLTLSILAGHDRKPKSVVGGTSTSQPTTETPTPGQGGLLDTLKKQEEQPTGPQVPRSQ